MNFFPVRSYDNYISANLVLQRLEEEGIRAYLQDEHTVTIDPILSNAIGGIKLMILEDHVKRALELLEIFEKDYKKALKCPKCGSDDVHYVTEAKNPANWLSAIATWLFGNYAVAVKNIYRCFNCKSEFETLPDQTEDFS